MHTRHVTSFWLICSVRACVCVIQDMANQRAINRQWKARLISDTLCVYTHTKAWYPEHENADDIPDTTCARCDAKRARPRGPMGVRDQCYQDDDGYMQWVDGPVPCCTANVHDGSAVCSHCLTRYGAFRWHSTPPSIEATVQAQILKNRIEDAENEHQRRMRKVSIWRKIRFAVNEIIHHPLKGAPIAAAVVITGGGAAALAPVLGTSTLAAGAVIGAMGGAIGAAANHAHGLDFAKQVAIGAACGAAGAHLASLNEAAAANAAAQHALAVGPQSAATTAKLASLAQAADVIKTQAILTVAAQSGVVAALDGECNPTLAMASSVVGHVAGSAAASAVLAPDALPVLASVIERSTSAATRVVIQNTIADDDNDKKKEKENVAHAAALAAGGAVLGAVMRNVISRWFPKPLRQRPARTRARKPNKSPLPRDRPLTVYHAGVPVHHVITRDHQRVLVIQDRKHPERLVWIKQQAAHKNTPSSSSKLQGYRTLYRQCKAAGGGAKACARQVGFMIVQGAIREDPHNQHIPLYLSSETFQIIGDLALKGVNVDMTRLPAINHPYAHAIRGAVRRIPRGMRRQFQKMTALMSPSSSTTIEPTHPNPQLLDKCLKAGGNKEWCHNITAGIDPQTRVTYRFIDCSSHVSTSHKPNPLAPSGQYF